jgi:hypothetical protein
MSRVFDFLERWVAETEQKRDSGVGERKSEKREEGSALEDIFETGTLANSTRIGSIRIWTGSMANARPLKPPCAARK